MRSCRCVRAGNGSGPASELCDFPGIIRAESVGLKDDRFRLPESQSPMFEQAFKRIDDILRNEAGCTTELDYTEQTSWLLFLKYLDGLEEDKAAEAALHGKSYGYILAKPYRWDTWAAPKKADGKTIDDKKAM